MELKLANGVSVSITEEEGTKVLAFDHVVRVIALEPEEASRIGASLYRAHKGTVFPALAKLVDMEFFEAPRTFPEIRQAVKKIDPTVKPSSITMGLRSLSEKHIISRSGSRRHYVYNKH